MFKKKEQPTKAKKKIEEKETVLGKYKKIPLSENTKAMDILKDATDEVKKSKEDVQIIIFTKDGDKACIHSHGSKRTFTTFVMSAIDSDLVDVDVLEKFIKVNKLKKIIDEGPKHLKEVLEDLL